LHWFEAFPAPTGDGAIELQAEVSLNFNPRREELREACQKLHSEFQDFAMELTLERGPYLPKCRQFSTMAAKFCRRAERAVILFGADDGGDPVASQLRGQFEPLVEHIRTSVVAVLSQAQSGTEPNAQAVVAAVAREAARITEQIAAIAEQ